MAAAKEAAQTPEIQLHAAIILAANGKDAAAATALATAVRLNPQLDQQPEVRELRRRLPAVK